MVIKILMDNISKNELICEWGLAVYIEHRGRRLLLDTGSSGKFTENARDLGIDLNAISFGVLSHAHYDHADGMEAFFEENTHAPFFLRAGTKENCYDGRDGDSRYIGIRPGLLERYSSRIVYVEGDYEICPGIWLIPHKTLGLEEIGKKVNLYTREEDGWHPETFAHEQSLVIDTEEGMVIFNSCSHGGADYIIQEIADTFPRKRICAFIGGFHLYKASEEEVRAFAARVRETGIRRIATGHCTGEEAFVVLKEELGDVVEQIYTGMEIRLQD